MTKSVAELRGELFDMRLAMTEKMMESCDDDWPDVEYDNAVEICERWGLTDEEFIEWFADNWHNSQSFS